MFLVTKDGVWVQMINGLFDNESDSVQFAIKLFHNMTDYYHTISVSIIKKESSISKEILKPIFIFEGEKKGMQVEIIEDI